MNPEKHCITLNDSLKTQDSVLQHVGQTNSNKSKNFNTMWNTKDEWINCQDSLFVWDMCCCNLLQKIFTLTSSLSFLPNDSWCSRGFLVVFGLDCTAVVGVWFQSFNLTWSSWWNFVNYICNIVLLIQSIDQHVKTEAKYNQTCFR